MLNVIIALYVNTGFFLRYCFWKAILYCRGGSLGENIKIFSGVRLASSKGHPINIGDNVTLMPGVIISTAQSGKFTIGNNVYIGEYSVLTSNSHIIIEDDCLIAPNNNLVDFDHDFSDPDKKIIEQGFKASPITVKKGAWIGCNCCILKGTTIGEGAVIGAGSVVTKDIPSFSVAAGNPAVIIKKR